MSETPDRLPSEEVEEAMMGTMKDFIADAAALTHASNWEAMAQKLDKEINSMGAGKEPSFECALAVVIRADLPKIKQILEGFYNADRDRMMQNLAAFLKAVPV